MLTCEKSRRFTANGKGSTDVQGKQIGLFFSSGVAMCYTYIRTYLEWRDSILHQEKVPTRRLVLLKLR